MEKLWRSGVRRPPLAEGPDAPCWWLGAGGGRPGRPRLRGRFSTHCGYACCYGGVGGGRGGCMVSLLVVSCTGRAVVQDYSGQCLAQSFAESRLEIR